MPRKPIKRQNRRDFGSVHSEGTSTSPSYSARWVEGSTRRRKRGFRTRGDAEAFLARVRVELSDGTRPVDMASSDVTVGDAIAAYEKQLREKGNKPTPIKDTLRRLHLFFTKSETMLSDLTPSTCARLYDDLRRRPSPRTGKPYAVDTQRNALVESRSLLKWCVTKRRWLNRNPLDGLEGKGRRKHGKPQLRIDEARRWMAKAMEIADAGEAGAVAAMMSLILGMRATEIVSRVARDLDDGGKLLWIPDSKTEAGKRTLRIPEVLQSHLTNLALGKGPDALLFGKHWRDWPRQWVGNICRLAGVPPVSAHAMRGLHSTLAMDAGVTGAVVAASLGHESVTTTVQSYAKPEAVSSARQKRTLAVLQGGLGTQGTG